MRFEAIDWASVSDDAPTTWLSEHGCGCGGTCGTCTEGTSLWASVAEGPGEWLAEHGVRSSGRRRRVASGTSGGSGSDAVCRDAAGDPVPCCDRSGDEVDCCAEDCWTGWTGLCGQGCEVAGQGAERKDSGFDATLEWALEDLDEVLSGDVAYLTRPDGWKEWVTCRLRGSNVACRSAQDLDRDVSDIVYLDPEDYAGRVRVRGGSADERALVRAAWGLMGENLSLVKWAVCQVTGDESDADGMMDRIRGDVKMTVGYHARACGGEHSLASSQFGTRRIDVCTTGTEWDALVARWAARTGHTPTADMRAACAAILMASLFVHELTHSVGMSPGDEPGTCADSFLIGNTFLWALLDRYGEESADVWAGSCCRDLAARAVFGSDMGYSPDGC